MWYSGKIHKVYQVSGFDSCLANFRRNFFDYVFLANRTTTHRYLVMTPQLRSDLMIFELLLTRLRVVNKGGTQWLGTTQSTTQAVPPVSYTPAQEHQISNTTGSLESDGGTN